MTTMAKVVRFHQIGGSEVLQVENLPIAEPGANEVRIKVEAIGLNRAENFYHEGLYLYQPKLPSSLGYEAAGIVEAVGSNVLGIQVGDRVSTIPAFSMAEYGVYGEHAIVPAYAVTHYPEDFGNRGSDPPDCCIDWNFCAASGTTPAFCPASGSLLRNAKRRHRRLWNDE